MSAQGDDLERLWVRRINAAVNRRLTVLVTTGFFKLLDLADSDADLLAFAHSPDADLLGPWATDWDRTALASLNDWLAAVNDKVLQRRVSKARPDQLPRMLTEEVVAMSPLSGAERDHLWARLCEGGPPDSTTLVKARILRLLEFHVAVFEDLPDGQTVGALRQYQEKQARRLFPKALQDDMLCLNGWVLWRTFIRMQVLEPRLVAIRQTGGTTLEELDALMTEIEGGGPREYAA